jgi:GntR family transcriptional regulator
MSEIQRGALYRQVAAAMREAIATGEFPPGAPLPSEAQFIARYGCRAPLSATPSRSSGRKD